MHARHRRPVRRAAAPVLLAACLALALPNLAACTTAYTDTLKTELRLSPAGLVHLRLSESMESLEAARDALAHADDGLRDLAMGGPDGAERRHADLERRAQRAQAAALDARRRIASVFDVAPGYLRTLEPDSPRIGSFHALAQDLEAADRALLAAMDRLEVDLPTLGAAPAPAAADDLRAPLRAAIEAVARANKAARAFTNNLPDQ